MKVKVTPAARKKAKGKKGKPVTQKRKAVPEKTKPVTSKTKAVPSKSADAPLKRPANNAAPIHSPTDLKRMQALVDLSPDVIAIAATDRSVLFWSHGAARATERSAKEAMGADFFELLNIAENVALIEAFESVVAGGAWKGEFTIVAPDGTRRTLLGRWKFLPGGKAAKASVLLLHQDITELKNGNMGSLRAQRLASAGELACGIAHDLNNVLSPIVIGADALEAISSGESADIVKLIKESAQRAAKIVRQVLLFVRGHDEEKSPATQDAGAGASPDADSPQASGELIIVADDEPVIAELCRCVLESRGYRVEVAVDGVAALALFDQYRSSVRAIVSDMAMPFMDGVDLTRAIRRLEPKVPILIATGAADVVARAALEAFPFVSLLAKPYTQRDLIGALQSCLGTAVRK